MALIALTCRKTDCKVAAGGVCAEGHDPPQSCPNIGDLGTDDDEESTANGVEARSGVELPSGEALSIAGADEFVRRRAATFVTIIGERDSGKTTLICSLYDRLLKGDFAGFSFAESWTLVGLERRSHYSRVDSGRAAPDTAHTSIQEGVQFLHLGVTENGDASRRCDLLFSDRAGETYAAIRGKPASARELIEVTKADRVMLLLDGSRVAQAEERASALQAVRQTLRALIQDGGVSSDAIVQVVTSKIDVIHSHTKRLAIEDQLKIFREQLSSAFAGTVAELTFHDIAARDPTGALLPAHGIDALLEGWTKTKVQVTKPYLRQIALETEFDRLLERPVGGALP